MIIDPISDMLTRIRNAQAVSKKTVDLPFSKAVLALAKILQKNKYIKKAEKIIPNEEQKKQGQKFNFIRINLKYDADKQPVMEHIKRISKPGQRIYKKFSQLKPVRQGYGKWIISTSRGLLTDAQSRKKRLGGEVVCEIW